MFVTGRAMCSGQAGLLVEKRCCFTLSEVGSSDQTNTKSLLEGLSMAKTFTRAKVPIDVQRQNRVCGSKQGRLCSRIAAQGSRKAVDVWVRPAIIGKNSRRRPQASCRLGEIVLFQAYQAYHRP